MSKLYENSRIKIYIIANTFLLFFFINYNFPVLKCYLCLMAVNGVVAKVIQASKEWVHCSRLKWGGFVSVYTCQTLIGVLKAKLCWFSKTENWSAASIKKKNDNSMGGSLLLDLTDDIEHY